MPSAMSTLSISRRAAKGLYPPDVSVTTPALCATDVVAAADCGRSRWDTSLTCASPPHKMTQEVMTVLIPKSK
jgi:hypothetical protein